MTNLKTRGWVLNALVAAIYIVLSIGPASLNLASGAIQFRLSESLNHLVVFDRKYIVGVVTGVVIFNAIFSPLGWLDVVFGGGQSLLGLLLVGWVAPKLRQLW
ncbi:QueT transporter family protein, partial [Lacticaseibacillus paracasei]